MTVSFSMRGSEGPPVIFLHGVGGDWRSFEPQLAHFSQSHIAIAWNMPGYGGSRPLQEMTFPALADALRELMDDLNLPSAYLVGHSIGGMVVQEFLARYPDRVRAAVLSATSPAFGRADGDFQKKFLTARLGPLDKGATMADLAPGIVDSLVGSDPDPASIKVATACMRDVPEAAYRQAMTCLTGFDRRDNLARINLPVLALAGEEDTNAPAPMVEKMAGKISGAEYICIPGAGHLANLERPEEFNAVVGDFLTRCATKTNA